MNRFSLVAATTALVLLIGCRSEPPATTPAPSPSPTKQPAAGKTDAGGSPLAVALQSLTNPATAQARPGSLLDQADALDAWASAQSGDAQPDAALTAARLRLFAITVANGDNELGTDASTLLRRIATNATLSAVPANKRAAAVTIQEAALAILGLDTDVKDVRINRSAALELAQSNTLAGQCVRTAWLSRALRSLDAWATLPTEIRARVALPLSGRMLCPRCADAHHITPDKVVSLLLGQGNAGGLVCDKAITAGLQATTPREQVGALSLCEELWPTSTTADPALFWGMNVPVIGLLRTAHALVQSPAPAGPLAPQITASVEAVKAHLARPWVLPTALVTASKRPTDATEPIVFIPGLGGAGLSTASEPLGVVSLGPDGLRVGLRPVLAYEGDELVSVSIRKSLPAGGRQVLSLDALRDAPRDGGGGLVPVTSALNELQLAAAEITKQLGRKSEPAPGVTFALDGQTAGTDAVRAITAMRAAGVEIIHVIKSASHGHTFPLMIREEITGTRTVLNTAPTIAYERPMIAVVTDTHVDVWAPDGPATKPEAPAKSPRPPEGTDVSYRGQNVARIRVPIADPTAGIQAAGLTTVNSAAAYFQKLSAAGPLLHVVNGKGARAADVVLVSRSFQERSGTALQTPHVFWPGTSCGGEPYKAHRRTPSDCTTGVAIAFSSLGTPSGRGLSSRQAGARLNKDAEPEPPPAPPASEAFCNKQDIRVAMNRNKGSFRFCYQRELQSTPDLAGRVVLRFTIGTDGRPKGAAIASSTLGNKTAHSCLLKTLKRMTFKPPKGGICPVRWPFTFQPK